MSAYGWLSDSSGRFVALMVTQALQLWPYWVSGVFIGAVAKRFLKGPAIKDFLARSGPFAIPAAALMGVVSPLCLFGALPVLSPLAAAGLGTPAIWAFLVASPLMNPSLFVMTWGGLSPAMALGRLAVAFLMGLAAGAIVHLLERRGKHAWTRPVSLDLGATEAAAAIDADCAGVALSGGIDRPLSMPWLRKLMSDFMDSLYFTGKYLLVGMALAALVDILVPPLWVMRALGGSSNGFAVLVATGLGIPLYMCGGGSIPLIRQWMYVNGLSLGGAMAFMVTGPSTKASNFAALVPALGRRGFALYMAINIGGAVLIGYGVDAVARLIR